jgi:penicillin-binding protein 1A
MPPQNVQAPVPLRPIPSDGAYRPPPTRASAPPPNPNARPEAGAGLDGWLVDRLFGSNR